MPIYILLHRQENCIYPHLIFHCSSDLKMELGKFEEGSWASRENLSEVAFKVFNNRAQEMIKWKWNRLNASWWYLHFKVIRKRNKAPTKSPQSLQDHVSSEHWRTLGQGLSKSSVPTKVMSSPRRKGTLEVRLSQDLWELGQFFQTQGQLQHVLPQSARNGCCWRHTNKFQVPWHLLSPSQQSSGLIS